MRSFAPSAQVQRARFVAGALTALALVHRGGASAVSAFAVQRPTPAAAATATVHLGDASDEHRAALQAVH